MTFPQIRRLVDSLMLKYARRSRSPPPAARRPAVLRRPHPRRYRQEAGTPALHRRMDPDLPPAGPGTQPPAPGPRLPQRLPGPLPRPSRPAPSQRAPARPAPQGRPPRHHPPRPRSPHPLLSRLSALTGGQYVLPGRRAFPKSLSELCSLDFETSPVRSNPAHPLILKILIQTIIERPWRFAPIRE